MEIGKIGGKKGVKTSNVKFDPKTFLSGVFSKENKK